MFKGDRNLSVGLFVSLAIVFLIAFIVWLTGRTGVEEMKRYSLMFQNNVSGLSVGGPVKYMGMNIGSVVGMKLDQEDGIKVRVDIEVLESTPVDQGTFASLALQGITGVAVVNLETEPGKHQPLEKLPGKKYPIIPVRVVGFSALMASAPEIMGKLDHLLAQASAMLGEENQESVAGTLENLEELTASLADNRESIAAIPDNLNLTITDIQVTVLQLQDMLGEMQPGIRSTIENLNRSSENLAALTGRFDALLREHEKDLGRFVEEGLGEAPALITDARKALRELEKLLQDLQDDPSQMIYRQADNSVEIEP